MTRNSSSIDVDLDILLSSHHYHRQHSSLGGWGGSFLSWVSLSCLASHAAIGAYKPLFLPYSFSSFGQAHCYMSWSGLLCALSWMRSWGMDVPMWDADENCLVENLFNPRFSCLCSRSALSVSSCMLGKEWEDSNWTMRKGKKKVPRCSHPLFSLCINVNALHIITMEHIKENI